MAYANRLSKTRHEQMNRPQRPVEVDPEDRESDYAMLDRMFLYAAPQVLDVVREADKADRRWRQTCADWQASDQAETAGYTK